LESEAGLEGCENYDEESIEVNFGAEDGVVQVVCMVVLQIP
jgi:hypothetical protein